MKISDFFKRQETKESRASRLLVMSQGQAVWSNRDYSAFAQEAYIKNVVAYQAINKVSEAVAAIKWTTWRGDTEITENGLLDLLKQPNPSQSGDEYIMAKIGYLLISGNAYEEKVMLGQEPKELYNLRPDRMKIYPSASGFPSSYCYEYNNKKVVWEVDPNTVTSDVYHTKLFNPTNDWYGLSPVEAGAFAVDQHNESMKWMQSLLQNSARPSGALTTKDESTLSEENFNRLKAQIEDQYSGSNNAGRPMLLEGGIGWQQMGLSPVDVGIIETKYSSARDVCLAFGVPPQLLGIPGDNTYSNYAEARLAFWEDTVIPLIHRVSKDWTKWLGPYFGDLEIKPDLDQVPAIVDKRMTLWQMADQSVDLTINERRILKGYEPIDGGEKLFVGAGQITLSDAAASLEDIIGSETIAGEEATQEAPSENVQAAALNGAQVSSMQAIVQNVADGLLPASSAIELILISFPTTDRSTVERMIGAANSFTPTTDDGTKNIDYKLLAKIAGYND